MSAPKPVLHRFANLGRRDEVTGELSTRCGLRGLRDSRPFPREEGEGYAIVSKGERHLIASWEIGATCAKCKLRLTSTERKVLRIMFDHGPKTHECDFHNDKKFDFQVGTGLHFYGVSPRRLVLEGLIQVDRTKRWVLSANGRLLAETFSKVIDAFDRGKR